MTVPRNVSRRHMLAIFAAGGLAGLSEARGQAPAAKQIEQLDPALEKIISTSDPLQRNNTEIEIVPGVPHAGDITAVAFSPNGGLVLSGSDDSTVKLWDIATGRLIPILRMSNR